MFEIPYYKKFCCCCSTRTGSAIIAVLGFLYGLYLFGLTIYLYVTANGAGSIEATSLRISLMQDSLAILITHGGVLYGLKKSKAEALLPFIIVSALTIAAVAIGLLLETVYSLVYLNFVNGFIYLGIGILSLLLGLYFLFTVKSVHTDLTGNNGEVLNSVGVDLK